METPSLESFENSPAPLVIACFQDISRTFFSLATRRDQAHPCKVFSTASPFTAFSCREGEFLDMQSQQCQKCAAGTYSLGTGIAFDEWDTLPSGFVTHGVNTNGEDVVTDCSKSVTHGTHLTFMHQ